VGEEMEAFAIHEGLACFHSPYFRATFQGNFQGASTREVIFDTTKPGVFGLSVEWLYNQDISETFCTDGSLSQFLKSLNETPTTPDLVNLWLLAEYLQVPRL
jgi:BTB/POZ domain